MKVFLDSFIPRLFPGLDVQYISHEGKQDLEKSIPRKLRAWNNPNDHFLIVRDNDGADCERLKDHLLRSCPDHARDRTLVRIACQELEAWYFGDPQALSEAYRKESLRHLGRKGRYRDPDAITEPSRALERLVPGFQKVSGARLMAPLISPERNRSHSFRVFIEGVERIAGGTGNRGVHRHEDIALRTSP